MVQFSFVIPTFNRKQNLSLVLWALCLQTDQDFEVVVSDDGSTDGTEEMVKAYLRHLRLKYYWHEDKGYRVSLTRNQGTRIADQTSTHIWFIDSDVLLVKEAVAFARGLCAREPDAIICGRYDWLPPMQVTLEDVAERFDLIAQARLPKAEIPGNFSRAYRDDPRASTDFDCETRRRGRGTLSGNLIVPRQWLSRGFDETIENQGQDGEFGHHVYELGAELIFCDKIRGYHLAHRADDAWKTQSVAKTIRHILTKYPHHFTEADLKKGWERWGDA